MKLMSRKEFLECPPYTVFQKYNKDFGTLTVKGTTIGDSDFNYVPICENIDAEDTGGYLDALTQFENGERIPLETDHEDCWVRDGLFEQDMMFAVWEPVEIQAMVAILAKGLNEETKERVCRLLKPTSR